MTSLDGIAALDTRGRVGVLTINSPPVNALGHAVRLAVLNAVQAFEANETLDALVIACAGRTFFAGGDIREFGKPPLSPNLPQVVNVIEKSAKPVVAAIHGTALGGGLELAMGCHFRVAAQSAACGLPEVKLGLLPGAGGTQRLPRLVGVSKALDMMTSGESIGAAEAMNLGLFDEIVPDHVLLDRAVALAGEKAKTQATRRTRDIVPEIPPADDFDRYLTTHAKKFGKLPAPRTIVQAVREGLPLAFEAATDFERTLFLDLMNSDESMALRHVFFAERDVLKVPGIGSETVPLPVSRIGVIGAGTMGAGIAVSALQAGFSVILVEQTEGALEKGRNTVAKILDRGVSSGRLTRSAADAALGNLQPSLQYHDLASADLIIEAAFEDPDVKKSIFSAIDKIAKPEAILATNTSYLDVDVFAGATTRSEKVVGLHFFSPANIMKLLEIVRGKQTAPEVLATAQILAKKLGKIPVVAGNAYGFIGNRMLAVRRREADQMILAGADPYAIDRIAEDFGFPMGPFRVSDLAGLDLGWTASTSKSATIRECLCELDRRGQKTKAGFYDYDHNLNPAPSPLVRKLIEDFSAREHVKRRTWSDQEILEGLLRPMIEEGQKILDEGIALRASDIDVVWIHGYGWPRWRGGPMYYGAKMNWLPA